MVRIIECRASGVLMVIPETSHVWRQQEPPAPLAASKSRVRRPLADFFRGVFRAKRRA